MQKSITKQKGAVVILMAFIIGLGVLAYLLHAFDPARLRLEQDKKTMQTLNEAKQALIAWSVSHQYTPGQMPWPDRHLDPLIYDGSSDCVTTPFQYSYLLGQLPSQPDTSPCLDPNNGLNVYLGLSTYPSLGQEFRDAQGNRLWYAVSRNLVRDHATSTNPVINPNIINVPTYPWLEVLDRNGNLVSNRVAAVILAPGDALDGQNRAGAADASQFLDRFQIGAAVFNNRGYATPDEDFIMGDDSRNVSDDDLTFVRPYNFNDKLIYITIDELMAALEKRVGEEVRNALKRFHDANGNYPFAAKLGSAKFYACETNNQIGVLPVTNPAPTTATCNYNRAGLNVTASCGVGGFGEVASIFFRKTITNFTASTGECIFSGRDCNCTGAGNCTRGAQIFQCDANANCDTAGSTSGEVRFIGGEFDAATMLGACNAPAAGNTCQMSAVDVRCVGIGAGSVTRNVCSDPVFNSGTSQLPAWIMNNRWQDYVFYEMTRPPPPIVLTVGIKDTAAVIVTTGAVIAPQARPSCAINDYLDSAVNVSADGVYEPTSRQRSNNYNDQTFVVAP